MAFRDELQTVYTADTRGFDRGARHVDRRLAGLERSMAGRLDRIDRRWSRSVRVIEGVRGAIAGLVVAGGLAAFGRQAVQVAANFEAAMNRVRAASGASKGEIAALREEAKRLGRETAFSASEAAAAIETLVRNGVKVTDILGGALEASLALASAMGGDLSRSADLATDVMAQFGFKASELGQVVDTVTGAMINSKFGFDDFVRAIGQGGAVAAQAGLSFEDFATGIAATAAAFTSGSDAGTSFKTFVTALAGNSKQASAEIARLGLNFFDASGKLRPLREIAGELQRALAGLSDKARTSSLKTIFGTDAIRTASELAKVGAAGFDKLGASIAKISAADQAEARMAGLEGAMKRVAAAWEGLLLALGDGGGLSAATAAAEGLAQALGFLSENLDLVAAGALAFAGARGTGALVASLNAQKAATAALVVQRQAELREAERARVVAQQEVALRRNALADLEREGASRARIANARRAATVANLQAAAATDAHADAVGRLAQAERRVSIAAGLAARAVGALRGVMAFFGGPVGLAITAISVGLYAIDSAAGDAEASLADLERRLGDVATGIEKVRQLDADLARDTDALTRANEVLEKAIAAQGDAAVDTARVEVDAVRKRIAASQQLRKEYALQLRAQLAVAEGKLRTARTKFESDFAGSGLTASEESFSGRPGAGSRLPSAAERAARRDATIEARRARIIERQSKGLPLSDSDVDLLTRSAKLLELERQAADTRAAIDLLNSPAPSVGGVGRPASADPDTGTPPPASPLPGSDSGGRGRATGDALGKIAAGSAERIAALESERAAIGKVGTELAFLEERARLYQEARREGVEFTPEVVAKLDAQAKAYAAAKGDVDRLREAEEILRRNQDANLTIEEKRAAVAEKLEKLRPALIELTGSEAEAQRVINAELERTNSLLGETEDLGRSLTDALISGFDDVASNIDNAEEAGKRLLQTLARIALQQVARPLLERLFGGIGSAIGIGGGGNWFWDSGGFTGTGGTLEPAGIVHRREFVVRAPYAERARPLLEAINAGRGGLPGFAGGGYAGPSMPAPTLPAMPAAPAVSFSSVTELNLYGDSARDPDAVLRALQPELDRRDRRLKDETLRAVSIRNRRDPSYLD